MDEKILPYGNVSNTVQVGDTVHRDTGPWTPNIHALLNHLHTHHFDFAPHVVGMDEKDREILSFIEGNAAVRPWPANLFTDSGLEQTGKLLRKYHDAITDFKPINDHWRIGEIALNPGQIILHGDLGPWNTIWKDGKLIGLIDWDFAHPGEKIEDLAQLAYYFIPLRSENGWRDAGFATRPDFTKRLRVLVDAYSAYSPAEVVVELLNLLERDRQRVTQLASKGIEPWLSFVKRGDIEESLADTKWILDIKPKLSGL